eukprot:GHVP01002154.1.p1 GENE.GHVP01002154.1~~GHVP01002154.1.p1  ORF type:complete len:1122 (+),score=230.01 GHVP01002154.1:810-4175(+)
MRLAVFGLSFFAYSANSRGIACVVNDKNLSADDVSNYIFWEYALEADVKMLDELGVALIKFDQQRNMKNMINSLLKSKFVSQCSPDVKMGRNLAALDTRRNFEVRKLQTSGFIDRAKDRLEAFYEIFPDSKAVDLSNPFVLTAKDGTKKEVFSKESLQSISLLNTIIGMPSNPKKEGNYKSLEPTPDLYDVIRDLFPARRLATSIIEPSEELVAISEIMGCDCEENELSDCPIQKNGGSVECSIVIPANENDGQTYLFETLTAINEAVAKNSDNILLLIWFDDFEDRYEARVAPRMMRYALYNASNRGSLPVIPSGIDQILGPLEGKTRDLPCEVSIPGLCVDDSSAAKAWKALNATDLALPRRKSHMVYGPELPGGSLGSSAAAASALNLVNVVQAIKIASEFQGGADKKGANIRILRSNDRLTFSATDQIKTLINPFQKVITSDDKSVGYSLDPLYSVQNALSTATKEASTEVSVCLLENTAIKGPSLRSLTTFEIVQCQAACFASIRCAGYYYTHESKRCELVEKNEGSFYAQGVTSGPKICPQMKEAFDLRNELGEIAALNVVNPGQAIPLKSVESNFPEVSSQGAIPAGSLGSIPAGSLGSIPAGSLGGAFASSANPFFDLFSLNDLLETGGAKVLSGPAFGASKDSMPPPPGALPVIAECHIPGMTCCVSRASISKWRKNTPYLNDRNTMECQAVYRPQEDLMCVTAKYEDDSCGTQIIDTTDFIVYRNILTIPERSMNDAVCDCTISKSESSEDMKRIPDGYWKYSVKEEEEKAEARAKYNATAQKLNDALAFTQAVAKNNGWVNSAVSGTTVGTKLDQVAGSDIYSIISSIPSLQSIQSSARLLSETDEEISFDSHSQQCLVPWPQQCVAYRAECSRDETPDPRDPRCVPIPLLERGCAFEEFQINVLDKQCGSLNFQFPAFSFRDSSVFRIECDIGLVLYEKATVEEQCLLASKIEAGTSGLATLRPPALRGEYLLINLYNGFVLMRINQKLGAVEEVTTDEKEITKILYACEIMPDCKIETMQYSQLSFPVTIEVIPSRDSPIVIESFQKTPDGLLLEQEPTPGTRKFSVLENSPTSLFLKENNPFQEVPGVTTRSLFAYLLRPSIFLAPH